MIFLKGEFAYMKSMKTLQKSLSGCRNLSTSSGLVHYGSLSHFASPPPSLHQKNYLLRTVIPLGSARRSLHTETDHALKKIKPPKNWGFSIVPEQQAYVVERFGKYVKTLPPGIHFLVPFIYKIQYVHSLKEQVIPIKTQTGITKDNVPIAVNGVLYMRIIDPVLASYGIEDPIYAVLQIAQTAMRSEIGKISLDKTFVERVELNKHILDSINERPLRKDWGVDCLRYEIKDIFPPTGVSDAMRKIAEAERRRRTIVLHSEGKRQAETNIAEGKKMAVVLESEGAKLDRINRAEGEAEAILANAQATAKGISKVSQAIQESGGADAASLKIAEQYIEVLDKINKAGDVVLLPENASDAASMMVQAVTLYNKLSKKT